jgi:hypothetical protein
MDNTRARTFMVRRAAAADAAALTRLREVMLSEMGMLAAGADPGWRDKAEAWFAQRLDSKDDFAAFVIEDPDLGVVSCAFRDETGARVINLNATSDGTALYRSLGFTEPRYPVLQLRLVRPGARP